MAVAVAVVVGFMCITTGHVAHASIDELCRARCTAACMDQHNKSRCHSECGLLMQTKPGRCPPTNTLSVFERACFQECFRDVDCPGTDKCCVHQCGVTCQHTVGLDKEPGLPPIPVNLKVTETKRQRYKTVQWTPSNPGVGRVLYVVQERKHAGLQRTSQLFDSWRTRSRRRKNKHLLTSLTPGHWYQVRVAAVNANGSRGYSEPSQPFILDIEPNLPEEPYNLSVSRQGWVDGRLSAELYWERPMSDLPLHHYKVYWSHCVKDQQENLTSNPCKPNRDSVIVKHKTISYKNTNFILRDLEPFSLYFIQVQAITIPYGRKKLSSEKAAIFIDTNLLQNATYNWRVQPQNTVKNLRVVNFHRTTSGNLEARLVWSASPGRFQISWAPHPTCSSARNNPTYQAITEAFHYSIDHLAFNCKYEVMVNTLSTSKSARFAFTTPLCNQVNSKLPC